MTARITVIGIGEDGLDGLSPRALQALDVSYVVAGGQRHLALVTDFEGERIDWDKGIDAGLDAIAGHVEAGRRVAVLASGDPLYFGVGKNVVERFGAEHVSILPAPGAVDLTCAAMGWAQPDVQVVTLHGRPLESLALYLTPNRRLVALSEDGSTPGQVARLLTERGFGPSRMTVLEHLGGRREKRIEDLASAWTYKHAADLNTIAIDLKATADARPLSRLAGLPDAAFANDGQLTKRAVRAVTLSSLAPLPGELLWDLGAGAGSISIEWMRAHESCRAVAVERDPARAERIQANAANLGVPRLKVCVGDSLETLGKLAAQPDARPDAVFVGGGVSTAGLLTAAWACLRPGGRLVANAVTNASAIALEAFHETHGGERFVIAVEEKASITHYVGVKPLDDHQETET